MSTFTVHYTPEMLRRANRLVYLKDSSSPLYWSLGIAAFGVLGMVIGYMNWLTISALAAPVLLAICWFLWARIIQRRTLKKRSDLEVEVELEESSLGFSTSLRSSRYDWSLVSSVRRLDDLWLVDIESSPAPLLLPESAMSSEQAAFFVERVETHGGKVR